jgi:hypothetical protein
MLVHRLVGDGMQRLIVAGVLLAVLALFGIPWRVQGAAPPKAKPLTEEQKARLKERDRLFAEAMSLARAGKVAETIPAMQKVVAIERDVFGNVHEKVAQSLTSLARLEELRDGFGAATKAHKEALAIVTKLYGNKDWRTIDARWKLDGLERRARLSRADRKQLAQADALQRQVHNLYGKGRYQEALPLARKVAK